MYVPKKYCRYPKQEANIICYINTVNVKISKPEWLNSLHSFHHSTKAARPTRFPGQSIPAHCWGPHARVCKAHVAAPFLTTWLEEKEVRSEGALPWKVRHDEKANRLTSTGKTKYSADKIWSCDNSSYGCRSGSWWCLLPWTLNPGVVRSPQLMFDLADLETKAAVAGVAEKRMERSWLNQKLKILSVS